MRRHLPAVALGILVLATLHVLAVGLSNSVDELPVQQWSAPQFWHPGQAPPSSVDRGRPADRETRAVVNVAPTATPTPLPTPAPPSAMPFVAITPCRLIDTRGLSTPNPPYPLPTGYGSDNPLVAGATADYQVTGASHCSIPAGAKAVSANITVTSFTLDGYLTAYPSDVVRPFTATMNWRSAVPPVAGQYSQNAGVLELSPTGQTRVYALQFAKVIVDVNGYYAPRESSSPVAAEVLGGDPAPFAWGDLTTPGPAVSVVVPASGKVLVTLTAYMGVSGGAQAFMGVDISGANTLAPSTVQAVGVSNSVSPAGIGMLTSATIPFTGLNPGTTTFTAKYIAFSAAATFSYRRIVVTPMP